MRYLELRKKYVVLISYLFYFVVTLTGLLSATAFRDTVLRFTVFYILGAFALFCILEALLVKCPHCGKRPVKLLKEFPSHCPHCEKEL